MSDQAPAIDQSQGSDEPRLAIWERYTDWPLTGLALAFLVGYAWRVLVNDSTAALAAALDATLWLIWAVFAADLVIRLLLARRKGRFLARNLVDVIIVLLPMLRQLRVLRLVTVLTVLNRKVPMSVRGKVGLHIGVVTVLVGTSAALAVLDAERDDPDATITSFPDALWWTLTTISTVGYGDRYPVTTEGRLVAGALMIAGIALLGVLTGTIASWFVERMHGIEASMEQVTREEIRELRAELAALRAELSVNRADRGPPTEP